MYTEDDDLQDPYVSEELLEYLGKVFGISSLLAHHCEDAEEHIGYMKGVQDVINHLAAIHAAQNEK